MRRTARFVLALGPEWLLSTAALLAVAALALALGGRLGFGPDSRAPLVLFAVLVGATAIARAPLLIRRRTSERRLFVAAIARSVRLWAPFLLLYACYGALHDATSELVTRGVEDSLKAFDEALFGISPSFWMQHFATPWLTDIMAFGYGLMFALPLSVLVLLHVRGREEAFREVALGLLATFYIGFALYLLVPARSPGVVYAYETELRGAIGLYEAWTLGWDRARQVAFDAFPSLHTAVSTIALCCAWRHGTALSARRPRLFFWLLLPAVVLLQISTLYLRQHYFVDLLAGWLLAAVAVWLGRSAAHRWARLVSANLRSAVSPQAPEVVERSAQRGAAMRVASKS